ncbi:50S ribosomal protein L10 [Geodia barretti]|uniref:Large ribosomal subunit protein uL10m n=1 Tax=Geodia barretti TaxID=519541 RepID=A0AA35SC44_GEOBA|nr:50S ribosomal protein L10 [Geodia barretti]
MTDLKEKLASSDFLISTGFSGLNVSTMNDFRRKLHAQGLEYRVVKNTLATLAAMEIGTPQVKELLTGPTGLVIGKGDPAEAAKMLTEHIRTSRITMPVNGAIVEGQVLSAQQLMGQIAGVAARVARSVNGPAQGLAIVLGGPGRGVATVLQRNVEKQGS